MNGLKENVIAKLRLCEPQKLSEAMNKVRRVGKKNWTGVNIYLEVKLS